jgi:hypothetical protein
VQINVYDMSQLLNHMKPPFLITVNQHPSFPCQLVEKSLWPEEPKLCARLCKRFSGDCDCHNDYERQKLSALQAGAVVEWNDLPDWWKIHLHDPIKGAVELGQSRVIAGVYELDPSRWAVEVKWQAFHHYWTDNTEEDATIANKRGFKTRKLAIISPVETTKEKHWRQKCNEAQQCHCTDLCMFYLADKQNNGSASISRCSIAEA